MAAALQARRLRPGARRPRPSGCSPRRCARRRCSRPCCPTCATGSMCSSAGSARRCPTGLPLVPAHGDFHVDQLLVGDGGIAVVDFDEMCAAPRRRSTSPPMPPTSCAAAPATCERVHAVLEPLLEGYGARPAALDWHLAAAVLARAAHPFQRQVPGWRERAEATVAVSEARPWLGRSSPAAPASSARTWPSRCSRTATRWSASTASPTTTPRSHKQANLGGRAPARRFSFVNADLVTVDAERLLDGCDVVFHLAAEPGVRSSWGQRFDRYLRNNIRATQRLLEASARTPGAPDRLRLLVLGVRRVRAAADARARRAAAAVAVRRDQARRRAAVPALPRQPRRRRRRAALLLGLRTAPAARHGVPALLRGGRSRARRSTSTATAARRATSRSSATSSRPPAPPRWRTASAGEAYNIGGGSRVSLAATLELLADIAGRPLDIRRHERESGDVQDTGADIARARADLGFAPADRARGRPARRVRVGARARAHAAGGRLGRLTRADTVRAP